MFHGKFLSQSMQTHVQHSDMHQTHKQKGLLPMELNRVFIKMT